MSVWGFAGHENKLVSLGSIGLSVTRFFLSVVLGLYTGRTAAEIVALLLYSFSPVRKCLFKYAAAIVFTFFRTHRLQRTCYKRLGAA
jgi:hypothetical protein